MKGEELTISYMSPLRRRGFTTKECRRRILMHEFGFLCHCEACEIDINPIQDFWKERVAGKKEDIKNDALEKGNANISISNPWKQSVPLNSPSSLKTFFNSPRHLNSLLSGASKSQNLKERDEKSVIVPKGVIVTRIEL